ncbi:UNVERIFIED_CONTAM: hypothetical protein PYX00_007121 [Menopon gallinae]|uniref:G-protein coupled receptors family 2 profile 2 domain-containing protein n=1 Tax=Menopon gallinae TaxID=328185 RepID=A0AAW2HHM6_9NEOP
METPVLLPLLSLLTFIINVPSVLSANDLSVKIPSSENAIIVHKCCEEDQMMNTEHYCFPANHTQSRPWSPIFSSDLGKHNVQVDFKLAYGLPVCTKTQEWLIYQYKNSLDQLILLPNGYLRHYTTNKDHEAEYEDDDEDDHLNSETVQNNQKRYWDYPQGTYCLDKFQLTVENTLIEAQGAIVCSPEMRTSWDDPSFIIKKVVDPILHVIAILCFLTVAIIYFVLPPLRDLVGNIITTMMLCMIVSQAAELVTIFTEFKNHVSFMVADIFRHVSLAGAFFWLNTFGYYIWKTFRSRNVFLRVTDGRKYCYYSVYAWGATALMTAIALVAHFLLDDTKDIPVAHHGEKTIGSLAMIMFFMPIAFTVIADIFFYLATGQTINRMSTYGRIHNKMKFCFEMFIKLFLIMTVAWLFLMLTWLRYDALIYCHIAINALQAPLILKICVLNQKRVIYLLKKTCCNQNCVFPCCRPDDNTPSDWGEEMVAMNTYNY